MRSTKVKIDSGEEFWVTGISFIGEYVQEHYSPEFENGVEGFVIDVLDEQTGEV